MIQLDYPGSTPDEGTWIRSLIQNGNFTRLHREDCSNLKSSRSTDAVVNSNSSLWRGVDGLKKEWAAKHPAVNDRKQEV